MIASISVTMWDMVAISEVLDTVNVNEPVNVPGF